jgi:hypothetical protein
MRIIILVLGLFVGLSASAREIAARKLLTSWAEVLVNGLKEIGVSTSGRP